MTGWTGADIDVVLDGTGSEGPVVTVRIRTPLGELEAMGEIEQFDRELVLAGIHIQLTT